VLSADELHRENIPFSNWILLILNDINYKAIKYEID
jgi:hypothetical protein